MSWQHNQRNIVLDEQQNLFRHLCAHRIERLEEASRHPPQLHPSEINKGLGYMVRDEQSPGVRAHSRITFLLPKV